MDLLKENLQKPHVFTFKYRLAPQMLLETNPQRAAQWHCSLRYSLMCTINGATTQQKAAAYARMPQQNCSMGLGSQWKILYKWRFEREPDL